MRVRLPGITDWTLPDKALGVTECKYLNQSLGTRIQNPGEFLVGDIIILILDSVCGYIAFYYFTTYIDGPSSVIALALWLITIAIAVVCSIRLMQSKLTAGIVVASIALCFQGAMLFYVLALLERLME